MRLFWYAHNQFLNARGVTVLLPKRLSVRLFTRVHKTNPAKILVACGRLEPIIHATIRIDRNENGLYG